MNQVLIPSLVFLPLLSSPHHHFHPQQQCNTAMTLTDTGVGVLDYLGYFVPVPEVHIHDPMQH